jgi:hypothetical protein
VAAASLDVFGACWLLRSALGLVFAAVWSKGLRPLLQRFWRHALAFAALQAVVLAFAD